MRRIFFLALLLPCFVFAYTSPGRPVGPLNDFAGFFSETEKQTLEADLLAIQKDTGVDFVVATIPNLGGDTIENYAVKLFEEWGIGKKDKDNGLLLLISKEDRELRFEIGYEVEGIFTDTESTIVIRDAITPSFREGNYFKGVQSGIQKTKEALGTELREAVKQNTNDSQNSSPLSFGFFVLFPILASILGRTKSWWLGGALGFVTSLVGFFFFGLSFGGWIITAIVFTLIGLFFDYIVSKNNGNHPGGFPPFFMMGGGGSGFGGGGGGGFGGFGGGLSGGGGSSGKW